MSSNTYPNVYIDVDDDSGSGAVSTTTTIPLHLPFFFIQAEKGPVGVPVLGAMAAHESTFGTLTFDTTQPYFSHSTVFARAAMNYQNVFLIRLADQTATAASLVLLATVTNVSMTQYEVDSTGAQIVDSSGNPVAKTSANGTPLTEPGLSISYGIRALAADETYDAVANVVEGTTANPTGTTYPIIATVGTSVGSAINREGFRLFYSTAASSTVAESVKSALYAFQPVTLAADNSGVVSVVDDIYTADVNYVSLKASAYDSDTAQYVDLNSILQNNYVDSSGDSTLDYNVHVYSDNVQAIGNAILALSPELADTVTDPFQINILTAVDPNGNPYQHVEVSSASAGVVNANVSLYNSGGSDGTVSKAQLESLVTAFVQGDDTAEFQDYFRYPFSHFYDSGYSLATKYALMTLFSLRDDVNLTFSTQDVALANNTAAQDQSAGAALLARIQANPESTLYGTPTMRAEIYQQVGLLATPNGWTNWVPATLDRMIKRCIYYSGDYVKGTPKGRPYSEVTVFKKMSWTAATPTMKQTNWNTALNTVSYADMNTLFYADLRTVYSDQTSLLSDGVFVDYLIFLKHIARARWTVYAGRDDSASKLFTTIANDINTQCNYVFGSRISATTTVTQTDADLRNGFSSTVTIAVQGSMPNRIWNVVIPVSRASTTTSSTTSSS